jgi:hypothetical protein
MSANAFIIRQAARIACLVFFLGAMTGPLAAQSKRYRPQPHYVQLAPPDQAKGRGILDDFRQRGIEKDYYLEFDLRVMPRRGAEKRIPGRAWGGRNPDGPVSRIELQLSPEGAAQRLLVQNGPASAIWNWHGEEPGMTARLDASAMFAPLGGTELTPFDLQMPFIFWDDFIYEGVTRQGDRPMQTFLIYPPEAIAAQNPALTGVRMFVDSAYHAMMRFQVIGGDGRVLKTMQLGSFKKVDGQWLMKEIDFRNDETRDKTRFDLAAAAAGLDLPPGVFSPEMLAQPIPPPARERLTQM